MALSELWLFQQFVLFVRPHLEWCPVESVKCLEVDTFLVFGKMSSFLRAAFSDKVKGKKTHWTIYWIHYTCELWGSGQVLSWSSGWPTQSEEHRGGVLAVGFATSYLSEDLPFPLATNVFSPHKSSYKKWGLLFQPLYFKRGALTVFFFFLLLILTSLNEDMHSFILKALWWHSSLCCFTNCKSNETQQELRLRLGLKTLFMFH